MAEKKRVLIIDDDPDIVDMCRLALEKADFEVHAAYDGRQGLEKAREVMPDAIILDVMMPEKDGFKACEELRQDPKIADIPVLMLTSVGQHFSDTSYSRSGGLTLDFEDYIEKPVDPDELINRIKKLISRS